MQRTSWHHGVTRYQWLVLFVAWLGWVFDAMDATIYTLVLHRYLQTRLPDYDYESHFGGVRYLFVRGMQPEQPMSGVYQDRPELAKVEALAKLIGGDL